MLRGNPSLDPVRTDDGYELAKPSKVLLRLELVAPAHRTEVQPALPDTWEPAVSKALTNTTNFFVMNLSPTRSQALLATVLVVSVAANIAAQAFGLSLYISAAFGLIAIAGGIALFFNYRKNLDDTRN
ncbi:hypothetical protein GCM10011609_33220 [Lentzea pudingi]|uniref:Uncharacterized protein n=1 Tax=Lentzea pudingi TaxID=1789439 RepID=A0ABQ2HZW0_9PSEU|nr:hypothetical protein [Lentzea pudingi]GGM93073.1 hypothetical protein GCM10011609_33220 [Lentzea pudingi]